MNNITTDGVVVPNGAQSTPEAQARPVNLQTSIVSNVPVNSALTQEVREALLQLLTQGPQSATLVKPENSDPLLLLKDLSLKLPSNAQLPESGDVKVQVKSEGSALFLQFIQTQVALIKPGAESQTMLPQPTQFQNLVENLFKEILTNTAKPITLESLREALLQTKPDAIQQPLLPLLNQLKTEIAPETLKELTSTVLTKSVFQSPEKLEAVLKLALAGKETGQPVETFSKLLESLSSSLQQGQSSPSKGTSQTIDLRPTSNSSQTGQNTPQESLIKTTLTLLQTINSNLTTDSGTSGNLAPLFKQFAPLLPQLERFFPHVTKSLGTSNEGLGILKELASRASQEGSLSLSQVERIALRSAVGQLTTALTSQGTNGEQSQAIERQIQFFQSRFDEVGTQNQQGKEKLRGMLENFVQGQEALRRLNPLMQQVGEPIFLLIPGFLQNFLQHLEVSVFPKTDATGEKGAGSGAGYQRVSAHFDFPSIGNVQVDIAYSSSHILLSLASPSEDVAEFIDTNLHLLKEPLTKLGFSRTELISRVSTSAEPNRPKWIEEVLGVKAIA